MNDKATQVELLAQCQEYAGRADDCGRLARAVLAARAPLQEPARRWPFVETPGEFTERLRAALDEFGALLPAVRYVLIETPPTLAAPSLKAAAPPEPTRVHDIYSMHNACMYQEHCKALDADNKRLYSEREALAAPLDALYQELLYAVGNKYPGETRHQTALRYIEQAEQVSTAGAAMALSSKEPGNLSEAPVEAVQRPSGETE